MGMNPVHLSSTFPHAWDHTTFTTWGFGRFVAECNALNLNNLSLATAKTLIHGLDEAGVANKRCVFCQGFGHNKRNSSQIACATLDDMGQNLLPCQQKYLRAAAVTTENDFDRQMGRHDN